MDAFERAAARELNEERRLGFRVHLMSYVVVQLMLVATWWLTSNGGEVMPWFVFPLFGWGIGVVAHYVVTRGARDRLGPSAGGGV